MLRSFLTITFRVLWRNKITSFVNIFGLSIGITAFIFIMLYIHHELSYDKFNENYNGNVPATVKIISEEWRKIYGSTPFDYHFLDETLDQKYRSDQQMTTVIGYFASLAIMLAALGLFAISSFMVIRRTKEIGIRKSLGARPATIYFMTVIGFLEMDIWAVFISSPVAFFLMKMWLDSFAYHIEIEPDIFVMAASLTLIVSLLTVTWQSLKAAAANPVKALRYE